MFDFRFRSKVSIRCLGIMSFSVNITLNELMLDFQRKVDALEDAILGMERRIMVGRDFKARTLE